MTTTRHESLPVAFQALREAARRATDAGCFEDALRFYDDALQVAKQDGSQQLIDLATCNRSGVAITLGDSTSIRSPLREALMRNTCVEVAFLAADNLSRSYEIGKNFKKGLFYARVARNHALATNNPVWLVSTYNQSGNCLLGDSYFEQAAGEYTQALDLLSSEPSIARATVLLNLGYCKSVLGKLDEGFRLGFQSLRWFRHHGARGYQAWSHLDLCYAYVQADRAERARRHGDRALAMAEASGDHDLVKNALFMLGEAERLAGDIDRAWEHFTRLQRSFYPETPHMAELMLAVDMRQMVNLRA